MRRIFSKTILAVTGLVFAFGSVPATADFAEKIAELEKREGLIESYIDHDTAKVYLALSEDAGGGYGRYIYAAYLTGGLGSNPLGLDRSLPTGSEILSFRRAGDRIMAVIENTRFRASANNAAEKRAVKTSFAESIIWSTKIVETEEATGKLLIDLSGFLTRDAVGVVARLSSRGQGKVKLDQERSYVDTQAAYSFPINMEFDAYVTYGGTKLGSEIRTTTPNPDAVTLIAHTTFLKLPEPGYEMRGDDERAGVISVSHIDMSAPLTGDTVVRLARRFRLQKDTDGKVINPIVFYIDNGAPEPIRGALLDGARWWEDAFEAAGFPGGYKAEILPAGVHPLDARYNVVNWVHRATRGWSYGAALDDPRTGEALRGVVLLGSLRVRQDIKIFEALAGTAKTGTGAADDPVELALARIRQLSAHEIGHSLGFAHNMAASTYGDRASVMDYPAPDVSLSAEGDLDFSKTYGVGVGAWDIWTAKFLYGDYQGTDEKAAQAALIAEADAAGLLYVSDGDSRSVGTGHAKGAVWDTGEDALQSLTKTMQVRRYALDRFGGKNLRSGESYKALQTKIVPLYLYHRYQLAAAAKYLGGYDFTYRHQGDGRSAAVPVKAEKQLEALELLLSTISPQALDLSDDVLAALTPLGRAGGDPQFRREVFSGPARPLFDHAGAAAAAADITLGALLHPARLLRIYELSMRDDTQIRLEAMFTHVVDRIVKVPRKENQKMLGLRTVVVASLVERLIDLQQSPSTPIVVRAHVRQTIASVRARLSGYGGRQASFAQEMRARIGDALAQARTPAVKKPVAPSVPPGSPIGAGSAEACWHCEALH